jgi:hypothetical protein
VVNAAKATVLKDVTRPLSSTLKTGIALSEPTLLCAVVTADREIVPLEVIVPPSSPVPAVMLVTVPPDRLETATVARLVTRPFASTLMIGTTVPLPTFV